MRFNCITYSVVNLSSLSHLLRPVTAIAILFLWAYLVVAATDTRFYAEALNTGFLTETPIIFIISVMVITGVIAAYMGIETIGRSADLFFPIFLLMIIGSLLAASPQVPGTIKNLEPVLARGAGPVIRGSITPIAIIAQYLTLGMLVPTVTHPKKALSSALWALFASSIILIIVAVAVVAILGPDRGARSVFPFFTMVRALQISIFLERVEVLAIFAWGFGLFIGVSVSLFCGAWGLSQLLGLKTYRPLLGPMGVIWVAFSFHSYHDVFQIQSLFQPHVVGPYVIIGWILVPMGLLWAGYGLRKIFRGGFNEKQDES